MITWEVRGHHTFISALACPAGVVVVVVDMIRRG